MIRSIWLAGLALLAAPVHAGVPSIPGVDAPELAALGPIGVGFRSVLLTHQNQPDVENPNPNGAEVQLVDRNLRVDIWYPATVKNGAKPIIYRGSLWAEPPHPPVNFTQKGMAVISAFWSAFGDTCAYALHWLASGSGEGRETACWPYGRVVGSARHTPLQTSRPSRNAYPTWRSHDP